jgi:hypothetical protein
MFRIHRFVLTFLASASLCGLLASPAHGQQGRCAGQGGGGAAAATASSGTTTAGNSTAGGRIALTNTGTTTGTVNSTTVQTQINRLRTAQAQLATGAVTLPANSQVSAVQVQNQLQVRINQLTVLRNQLTRAGR